MQTNNDTVGLYYTYCVIIRKLFLYTLITDENDPAFDGYVPPDYGVDSGGYSDDTRRLKM